MLSALYRVWMPDQMCPQHENLVCSGYGLPTVNYTMNNTLTGLGCQCNQTINLLSDIEMFDAAGKARILASLVPLFSQTYCGVVHFQFPNAFYADLPTTATCFCQDGRQGVDCELDKCPTVNGVVCNGRGHAAFGQGLATTTNPPSSQACVATCLPGLSPCPDGICRLSCNNDLVCSSSKPWRCADSSCQPTPNACGQGFSFGYLDRLDLARNVYLYPSPGLVVLDTPLVFFQLTGSGSMTLPNGTIIQSPSSGIVSRLYTDIDDWVSTGQSLFWISNPDSFGDVELYPLPDPVPSGAFRLSSPVGVVIMDFIKTVVTLVAFTNDSAPAQVIVQMPRGYYQPFTQAYVTLQQCLASLPQCLWNWDGMSITGNGITLCSGNCQQLAPINIVIQHFIGRQRTFLNNYRTGIWSPPICRSLKSFTQLLLLGNMTRVELITTGLL